MSGNHDAASEITRHLEPPANVIVAPTRRPGRFEFPDLDTIVHAQGFATRHCPESILGAWPPAERGAVNIGLLQQAEDRGLAVRVVLTGATPAHAAIVRDPERTLNEVRSMPLDLAAGQEGLHLVYGPNEARKSAALRAIHGFLFGIPVQSPDTFRYGGPAIRKSGGAAGETLFAAAVGGVRLQRLLAEVTAEADGLFKPRGVNLPLNKLLDEYKQAVSAVKELSTPGKTVAELRTREEGLRRRIGELEADLRAKRTESVRLERLQKAIPLLAESQGYANRLTALQNAPDLAEDCPGRRRTAQEALARHAAAAEQAQRKREALDAELEALAIPDALLAESPAIAQIYGELGQYESAVRDLPAQARLRDSHLEAARVILAELRPDLSLEHAGALRIPAVARERAQERDERVQEMSRFIAEYERRARQVVDNLAPDLLCSLPLEDTVRELERRRDTATKHAVRRDTLRKQADALEEDRQAAEEDRETADRLLAELLTEAGCQGIGELPAVETAAPEKRDCRKQLVRVEGLLRPFAGTGTLEALAAEAGLVNPDVLPSQLATLGQEINEVDTQLKTLYGEVAVARTDLAAVAGDDRAAEKASEAQALLAGIRTEAGRYLRARLAAALLQQETARYRETHAGDLVQAAGGLFARLTCGAFSGLGERLTEKEQPLLVGLRAAGGRTEEVTIEGMSAGTRDQLYLALRLAYLARHLQRNPPFPLILDDLLVNFDDERAAAALAVFGEFSRRTQVILFTHHQHLRELARSAVPTERLFEHELIA